MKNRLNVFPDFQDMNTVLRIASLVKGSSFQSNKTDALQTSCYTFSTPQEHGVLVRNLHASPSCDNPQPMFHNLNTSSSPPATATAALSYVLSLLREWEAALSHGSTGFPPNHTQHNCWAYTFSLRWGSQLCVSPLSNQGFWWNLPEPNSIESSLSPPNRDCWSVASKSQWKTDG